MDCSTLSGQLSQMFHQHQEYVGLLANNTLKTLHDVDSVVSCARHCESYTQCRGFSFSANNHQCDIKDSLPDCSTGDFHLPASDEVYYQQHDPPCTRSELSLQGLPTLQSTNYEGYDYSPRAIDGNKQTHWDSNSCSHTLATYGEWWMVDMKRTYCIRKVIIYNRSDCCKENLYGSVIRVGMDSNRANPECGSGVNMTQINSSPIIEMPCEMCGRYLSVHIPDTSPKALHMCELIAYVDECQTHTALPSCAAIKHACYSGGSGTYEIDPDGPNNGVEPFTVRCDMETGTTIIGHNNEADFETPTGFETTGSHIKEIVYQASIPQIAALTDVSTHCEQYIKYSCYDTAVLYGNGDWNVWWVSRDGDPMYNWGSVPTGTAACTCSLASGCDTGGICNCIANDRVWRSDEGVLYDKSKLPVTKIHSGDTGGAVEKALFTLGTLRCSGVHFP
ncbi:uncharacterized protein [Amphiura filiformis]|uniref:uncharacterized protein n=1 Tax=Amphiura filiformis TaxID=82378 RepID=UPI003B22600C